MMRVPGPVLGLGFSALWGTNPFEDLRKASHLLLREARMSSKLSSSFQEGGGGTPVQLWILV